MDIKHNLLRKKKQYEFLQRDVIFIKKNGLHSKKKRFEAISLLEKKADIILDIIKNVNKEDPQKEDFTALVNVVILLAEKFRDILYKKDNSSIKLIIKLELEKPFKDVVPFIEIIKKINNLNKNSLFCFGLVTTQKHYETFSYLYIFNALMYHYTFKSKIDLHQGLKKEVNKYQRNRINELEEEHKDYEFHIELHNMKNNLDKELEKKEAQQADYNGKIGAYIQKSIINPQNMIYRSLYNELKEINQHILGDDFNKREFMILFFDLFRLLSFQNHNASTFNYKNAPLSINKEHQIRKFKFQKMRDIFKER